MYKNLICFVAAGLFLSSCGNSVNEPKETTTTTTQPMPAAEPKADFSGVTFAVKKDLVCGMPVSAGISDTAHYKEKVYGFCATECKAEFLKNPEQYLTAAK